MYHITPFILTLPHRGYFILYGGLLYTASGTEQQSVHLSMFSWIFYHKGSPTLGKNVPTKPLAVIHHTQQIKNESCHNDFYQITKKEL